MDSQNPSFKYYSFTLSNFLAALGGGMILGKGVSILDLPYLQSGSIMAFFIGTLLGLLFLRSIPEKLSILFSKWFAISGGFSSLILLGIYKNYSIQGKLMNDAAIIFFFFLSIRFGFWFYSRVLRVSSVAGKGQQIAWVEFGYYSGMILGLIIWKLLGFNITLTTALLVDAILQFTAGLLDLFSYKISMEKSLRQAENQENKDMKSQKKFSSWELPCAVILATVSTQVIIFSLTHYVTDYLSSYILATFYFGASVGSIIFKKFNFKLVENYQNNQFKYVMILTNKLGVRKKISFISLGSLITGFVSLTILNLNYGLESHVGEILLLTCIFSSAFLYEILALSILDRIGWEDSLLDRKNGVIRTYALMGVCAALIFWVIGLTNSSLFGLFGILAVSVLFFAWLMEYNSRTVNS